MNKNLPCKRFIIDFMVFTALIAATFLLFFHMEDLGNIRLALQNAMPQYIFIAILCAVCFVLCEALNIKRVLTLLTYKIPFINCLKYAFAGFFFSSITPSASGGQPLQLYYMHKDKIEFSHASLALLLQFAGFQFVTAILALMAYFVDFTIFSAMTISLKILLAVGISINLLMMMLVLAAVFSKRISAKLIKFTVFILAKLNFKKLENIKNKLYEQLSNYHCGAEIIKKNKLTMFYMVMTNSVQLIALHSIPYFIYLAFGLNGYGYFTVVSLQAILYISVASLPLPGAVGISEGGFMLLFQTLFPSEILASAMLLSRGISFYLLLLLSGMALLLFYFSSPHQTILKKNK